MSWNIKTPGDYINGPLTVAGAATFNSQVTVNSTVQVTGGVTGQGALIGRDGSSGGAVYGSNIGNTNINSPASGTIRFNVNNGAFAGLFDASANFGIGVTPSAWTTYKVLQVGNGSLTNYSPTQDTGVNSNAYYASGQWYRISNGYACRYLLDGSSGIHMWQIAGTDIAGSIAAFGSAKMTLNANGALALSGGNASANGVGIAFPAAQSASTDANTLDDYEEGTWTGTLRGLTSDPTVAVTATGRYTKIGRQVTAQISFEGVSNAGASGDCFVAGLPFANGNLRTPGSAASYAGMTHTGTLISLVDGSSTNITFIDSRSNAAWVGAAHYPGTGRTICAEVTYTV